MQQTSLLAYKSVLRNESYLRESYRKILNCLRKVGSLTDREIAKFLGYQDPNKIRPRRNELVKHGFVKEADVRVCRVSGKTVLAWKLA